MPLPVLRLCNDRQRHRQVMFQVLVRTQFLSFTSSRYSFRELTTLQSFRYHINKLHDLDGAGGCDELTPAESYPELVRIFCCVF